MDESEDRRLVICRPAVIFGPGEGGNFTRMAKLLKKGFFIYPGRKDTIKACFYVEDLLDAMEFSARRQERFVLFNACYPDRYTLEQIVETFRDRHMHGAKTFLVPRGVVTLVATLLRPFSVMGLGIHPDRVTKLVRSTDVSPAGWRPSALPPRAGSRRRSTAGIPKAAGVSSRAIPARARSGFASGIAGKQRDRAFSRFEEKRK